MYLEACLISMYNKQFQNMLVLPLKSIHFEESGAELSLSKLKKKKFYFNCKPKIFKGSKVKSQKKKKELILLTCTRLMIIFQDPLPQPPGEHAYVSFAG